MHQALAVRSLGNAKGHQLSDYARDYQNLATTRDISHAATLEGGGYQGQPLATIMGLALRILVTRNNYQRSVVGLCQGASIIRSHGDHQADLYASGCLLLGNPNGSSHEKPAESFFGKHRASFTGKPQEHHSMERHKEQ